MCELTQNAKDFLSLYDSSFHSQDFFSFDFRKLRRKLTQFPDFSPDLLTPISPKSMSLSCEILKIWVSPITSLIDELLSAPNINEFDSFFKNALLYLEIERKALAFMDLFHADAEVSQNKYHSLSRFTKFLTNLKTLRTLLLTKEEETVNYRFYISEIFGFSYDLFQSFKCLFHLLDKMENAYFQKILSFLQKNFHDDSLSLPIRPSAMNLGEEVDSYEEIDLKFKEFYNSAPQFSGFNLPLSYMSALEKKSELGYNIDINTSAMRLQLQRKSEVENPLCPSPGNTSKRQRTLSRISQKIREKSVHISPFKKISGSGEDFLKVDEEKIFFFTEAQMREKELKQKMERVNKPPPSFINRFIAKKKEISEMEKEKLKFFNESAILGSVNYDEVKYDHKVDLTRDQRGLSKYEKNSSNVLKFKEKMLGIKLQEEDINTPSTTMHDSLSLESSSHKDMVISNRGSLLSSMKRNSKKLLSKVIKDPYDQMKEIEKKNQTILKTFKKNKEKSKIRHKKDAVISIVKINGVSFQEPEDIIGKNQVESLTPEFVKDVEENVSLSGSSSSSDDDEEEKEINVVLERKNFLNSLFQCSKPRLTLKRHSKIITGKEGKMDDKLRKISEKKKNLFQNWHLTEDVELLANVSAFNVKTSRESVNYFIIKYLINMKLKSHEYNSQLKVIRERWNKIKFAFQMFLLYRKLHEKRNISFFDEAHIIVHEMRQTSLLREFDQFLYLLEENIGEIEGKHRITIDGRQEISRSQSKNINKVLFGPEKVVEKVLILERSMSKFSPKRYWNNDMKFMIFDEGTIRSKLNEKIHPDVILL